MTAPANKLFDDRLLMTVGVPIISLIVVVFFLNQTPGTVGLSYFMTTWLVSSLYTATYWFIARWIIILWRTRKPRIEETGSRIIKTLISLIVVVIALDGRVGEGEF